MHKRTSTRVAHVSPPWVRDMNAVPWSSSGIRKHTFKHSTGGLRPPLLAPLQRPSAGRMAIFAMHKRTPKKSGGRQPAVGVSNAVAMAHAFVQRHELEPAVVLVGRAWLMVCDESPASAFLEPRGAYAPRSWLHVRTPLQMGDFRRREWQWSHGTVVVRQAPKLDSCDSRRSERYFSHGGLTPPALGCTCRHRCR
jgi:hypothetical protein